MPSLRFADAFAFAEKLHRGQVRTGTTIPYVSHLMAVAALVLEHGGDEDQAIAGLLHDAVEDQGGLITAQRIAVRYGVRVAQMVLACSDAIPEPGARKPPWRLRKAGFLARLPQTAPAAALVIACDKLHTLSTLLADLEREGPSTLVRFSCPAGLAWYYSSLAAALAPFAGTAPVSRLRQLADSFAGRLEGVALPSGGADA